ncbi:hypothetical protein D9M71_483650 [compost metagenome]
MATSNIEQFNEITGQVFALLYEEFPLPIALTPHSVGLDTDRAPKQNATTGEMIYPEISTDGEMFMRTIEWLASAGYLTCSSDRRWHIGNAVLTAKGLEVLNAIPEKLTKREPIGRQLAEASKSGGKELLRSITTEALGVGVRLLLKGSGLE